jgi:cephalosporin hydroxylase
MPESEFRSERIRRISEYGSDASLREIADSWILNSMKKMYLYNFDWLGRPIIQYPEDIVSVQELIWEVKPTLIIETGVAHGGSLMLSASILALIDYCDAAVSGSQLNPKDSIRKVIGVDIEIRKHNREAIENHPLGILIDLVEGSSTSSDVVAKIESEASKHESIMIFLDSNHTHEHVLDELKIYSKFVSVGSYCVVFDTFVENMPKGYFENRPWDKGNSPMTAVKEFLATNQQFEIDTFRENKLLITVAPSGHLRRVR